MGVAFIEEADRETVLLGEHNGSTIIVLGIRADADHDECWLAAVSLLMVLEVTGGDGMVVDVMNAVVRPVTVRRVPSVPVPD